MSELMNKQFSIDDVQMFNEDENVDFSVVEIWALADNNNSHRNPISNTVLHQYADTFKGKLIVAKFNELKQDAEAHETDEQIVGYVDPSAEIEFQTKVVDGIEKEFVVVKGLISKLYATNVVDMFRRYNERTVSCEFSCSTQYEEDRYGHARDENGNIIDNPILKYHIHGITILGLSYNPSVKGTEIKVKQFVDKYSTAETAKLLAEQLMQFANKLNTDNSTKESIMEDEKKLSESAENEENLVMEEADSEKKCESEENKDVDAEGCGDKEMEAEQENDGEEKKEEFAELNQNAEQETEDKQFEEGVADESEPKAFELKGFVALEFADDSEDKAIFDKLCEMSADDIVNTVLALNAEVAELKKFKESKCTEERDNKLDMLMASLKGNLDEKQFAELRAEGENTPLDEFNAFANKAKAFAWENVSTRESKNDGLLLFAGVQNTDVKNASEQTADDIFAKYL